MNIETILTHASLTPRHRVDDVLCNYLALFSNVLDKNNPQYGSDALQPRFLHWALDEQIHEVVGWLVCRATKESATALQGVLLAATLYETTGNSIGCNYRRVEHNKLYGWLNRALFDDENLEFNGFISPDDAGLLASVANYKHELFWLYTERPTYRNNGGAYAAHLKSRLKELAGQYTEILRARGILTSDIEIQDRIRFL
jgi:hypothetical protein